MGTSDREHTATNLLDFFCIWFGWKVCRILRDWSTSAKFVWFYYCTYSQVMDISNLEITDEGKDQYLAEIY